MAEDEIIGILDETYEEKSFEWKVKDFFSIIENKDIIRSSAFFFADTSFYFHMVPKSRRKPGFSVLYLNAKEKCKHNFVECDITLKRPDDNVETLGKFSFKKDAVISDRMYFKPLEIQEQKCEEAILNVFSITGKLRRRSNSYQHSLLNESKLVQLIKLDTLSENLENLLANKESCDTTLQVQDIEYKVHRALLIARSPVFAAMFLHETSEKQTGIVTVPDCDPESFEQFLKFLYCGKLEKPSSSAIHLHEIADKYEVLDLKTFCVEYLTSNLTVENLCDVVCFAEKHGEENLLNAAQCFFDKNVNKILRTSEWDCLVKNNYPLSKRLLLNMPKVKAVE